MRGLAAVALIVCTSCAREGTGARAVKDEAAAPSATPVPTRTFVWLLDQPAHAEYESTCYSFAPDGLLSASSVLSRETGTVRLGHTGPSCTFGDHWEAKGAHAMRIRMRCSDAKERTLTLDVAGPSRPKVIDVDGESGWAHLDFDWRLRTCDRDPKSPAPAQCCPNAGD